MRGSRTDISDKGKMRRSRSRQSLSENKRLSPLTEDKLSVAEQVNMVIQYWWQRSLAHFRPEMKPEMNRKLNYRIDFKISIL